MEATRGGRHGGRTPAGSGTLWSQAVLTLVDDRLRGRATRIDVMGSLSIMPLGTAVVGSAYGLVGARTLFMIGGVLVAGLAVVGLLVRSAREFVAVPASGNTPDERGSGEG